MGDDSFNAALNDAIQEDNPSQIRSLLRDLEWVDIADILTHSPPPTRRALWNNFDEALKGDVIAFVDQDIVGDLLVDLRPDEIAQSLREFLTLMILLTSFSSCQTTLATKFSKHSMRQTAKE